MGILKSGKVNIFLFSAMMMVILLCCCGQVQAAQDGDYTYTVTNGKSQITGYTGAGGVVTIPSTLGGAPVTSIGDNVFKGCTNLTSIVIPQGVTSIGDGAFYGCTGLTRIAIPESVTSIGYAMGWGAFYGCTGLTSIVIPRGVTMIGESTFSNCTGLTSIIIPQGVTYIGFNAFYGCTGLTSITIPSSVRNLGEQAFCACSGLSKIIFKSATTTIYDGAFTIPASTKIFGYDPSTAKTYATKYNRTFEVISKTTYIEPDYTYTITSGEDEAQITKYTGAGGVVTIPGTLGGFPVTSIGAGAFAWNSDLTSITIPQGVTNIGGEAFSNCTGLTSITIPQGLTSIGGWAFELTGLTSITIPESVTSIGNLAFFGCPLTSITVDINNSAYTSVGGVLYNKALTKLIQCPRSLTSIIIPQGVTSIANYAFYNCRDLTIIDIPESVTSIGYYAFSNCAGLASITFNSATTVITDDASTIPEQTTILGYDPSTAKDYAEKYNRKFEVCTVTGSTISPTASTFYKTASAQVDVTTTLTLNGNTLSKITNGVATLVEGKDYTVSGNTVTIKKEYLTTQAMGTTILTFNFSAGAAQILVITVMAEGSDPVSDYTLTADPEELTLFVKGKTATVKIYAEDADGAREVVTQQCTWKSDDEGVVKVIAAGKIKPIGVGEASVTASYQGCTVEIPVEVKKQIKSLTITPKTCIINPGDTKEVAVTIVYKDNTQEDITGQVSWKSSNELVATITDSVIKGINKGSATITASYGGKTGKIKVKVN